MTCGGYKEGELEHQNRIGFDLDFNPKVMVFFSFVFRIFNLLDVTEKEDNDKPVTEFPFFFTSASVLY